MTDQKAPTTRRLPRALTPFRHPAYRRLAVALVLQTFAGGVWLVGLVWEVIRLGGGPAQLSVVSTAGAVGIVLPALLGGVVADRVPQKVILLVVAITELSCMTVAAVLSLTDNSALWQLATLSFVIGMGMAFYWPAYSAWIPSLVDDEDLLAVNGFEGMIRPTVGQALGPAAAGAVVGAASPGAALLVAAIASFTGVLALSVVPLTPVRRELVDAQGQHPVVSMLHDLAEGFRYLVRTPWLLATLLFGSLMVLATMGPFEVLVPFVIKDRLGGDATDHAVVLAAYGIGAAVGSLLQASRPVPRRYLTYMNLMWGFGCLPMAAIGIAQSLWVIVVAAVVVGAMFAAPMVLWGMLLQRRVPPHLLGRVSSLDFFVSISLMPVSMAVAGPVSEAIGLTTTFVVAGVVPIVVAVVAIVAFKLPQDEIAHPL